MKQFRLSNHMLPLFAVVILQLVSGCSDEVSTQPEVGAFFIGLSSDHDVLNSGGTAELSISCTSFPDSLYGISMRIAYDASLVDVSERTSFTPGDLLGTESVFLFQVDPSLVHLSGVVTPPGVPASSSGVLGTITVTGVMAGDCAFSLDRSHLRLVDRQGNDFDTGDLEFEPTFIEVR